MSIKKYKPEQFVAVLRQIEVQLATGTPTISGTVIMLIPVTMMSIVFDLLKDVPNGTSASAAPLSALATLLIISGIALKATGTLRLWAPVAGVVFGSLAAERSRPAQEIESTHKYVNNIMRKIRSKKNSQKTKHTSQAATVSATR